VGCFLARPRLQACGGALQATELRAGLAEGRIVGGVDGGDGAAQLAEMVLDGGAA